MTPGAPTPSPSITDASAQLGDAENWLRARGAAPPLGLVLGSGLGHLVDQLEDTERFAYADIPHMPRPLVAGHGGELVLGRLGGTRVACLSGRVHLYEGHAPDRVAFGVRLLARWGVGAIVLTNAAGGISRDLVPGSLMIIDDHLNLTGQSPLVGPNQDSWGPRFPDMTRAYDRELSDLTEQLGRELGLSIVRGVYAGLLGPSYETPAEIRMLERCGADAVGMSTVLETLALRHLGVRVVGISCITNLAAGKGAGELSHEEVGAVAARVKFAFGGLLELLAARGPWSAPPVMSP